MMTLEEYKLKAAEGIKKLLHAVPPDEVEEYIQSLNEDMEHSYNESVEASKILGTDQISPDGYAYGAALEF
ncbi:MAG: hypothetical protein HPY94_03985 [Clostridia bacterium]|nr:hypothetical protein [Clostridia bacterium]